MPSKTLKRGSRRQVYNGAAVMTAGGLKKDDLIKNKYGRIVSAKKHTTMKQKHGGSENGNENDMKPESNNE
jgi:predicted ribosome-associated RNA-binding protein Tma20